MSDPAVPEPDPDNPFAGIPFLGDMMKMVGQQGMGGWDTAKQVAVSLAAGGATEANVDPLERIRYEELCRIAELHLRQIPGLELAEARVVPVNRSTWAHQALTDWKDLFERLSAALAKSGPLPEGDEPDPMAAMFANLSRMVAPMWLGMAAGSMVGRLAQGALGTYHLPIPRLDGSPLQVVVPNVVAFGDEWTLEADDLRLWVCLSELTHHSVLGRAHVRERLTTRLADYIDAFEPNPSALEDKLGSLDLSSMSDLSGLQKLFSDPEVILGAVRSARQEAMRPAVEAIVVVAEGYVDHVLDRVTPRVLGGGGRLSEAVRRARVEENDADRFVERLLGLELAEHAYERGRAFVDGIVARAGDRGLARLWESDESLPTPAEVDAPGLWLARLDIEVDEDFGETLSMDDLDKLLGDDNPSDD